MQEEAHQLGENVGEGAARATEAGKAKLSEQLDRQTSEAGSQARSLATTLRRSSRQLAAERGESHSTRLSNSLAERLEQAGAYLERTQGSQLLDDAEQFARQRPWVVAGAAAVAGLMASRLLKASSDRRYERSTLGPTWSDPGRGTRRTVTENLRTSNDRDPAAYASGV
jgi:ElaB/YqjD/DUF883 family membrane-anchored ribosome-binding protein